MNGPSPETFLGFPFLDITGLETGPEAGPEFDADIAIFGAPHGTPYDPGALSHSADAPAAIRAASARDTSRRDHYDFDVGGTMITNPRLRVADCGDVPGDPSDPEGNRDAIRSTTTALLDAGACPILLGGDDSVPIPYLQAFAGRGPIWVVQLDAHLDWRDERGGERLGWSSTMRRISEMDHVEGMVQVGLRGIGSARAEEVAAARDWGSHLVTAAQIHEHGVEAAIALAPEGAQVIITFDCDALDPAIMPGVLSRAPGGLSYAQAVSLIAGLARRCKLAGFDLVELSPARDADGLSALTAYRIVANAISGISRALHPAE